MSDCSDYYSTHKPYLPVSMETTKHLTDLLPHALPSILPSCFDAFMCSQKNQKNGFSVQNHLVDSRVFCHYEHVIEGCYLVLVTPALHSVSSVTRGDLVEKKQIKVSFIKRLLLAPDWQHTQLHVTPNSPKHSLNKHSGFL